MNKPKVLVIKRSEWIRGKINQTKQGGSVLLDPRTNCKCCLGFYGLACNIAETAMKRKGDPVEIGKKSFKQWREKAPWLFHANRFHMYRSEDCDELISINDDTVIEMTDAIRESKIKKIFAKHDVKVKFVK